MRINSSRVYLSLVTICKLERILEGDIAALWLEGFGGN